MTARLAAVSDGGRNPAGGARGCRETSQRSSQPSGSTSRRGIRAASPGFYSRAGQCARLTAVERDREAGTAYRFLILEGGELAGEVSITNVVRRAFQSANPRLLGGGRALRPRCRHRRGGRRSARSRSTSSSCTASRPARCCTTSAPRSCSTATASSRSASHRSTCASQAPGAITCSSSASPTRRARRSALSALARRISLLADPHVARVGRLPVRGVRANEQLSDPSSVSTDEPFSRDSQPNYRIVLKSLLFAAMLRVRRPARHPFHA